MPWWSAALASSVFTALYIYSNQIFRLPASVMMIYRGLGLALVLLPFLFFITPHFGWWFYALSVFQGALISFSDYRIVNASKDYGAEITSVAPPLTIGCIFILWLVLRPAALWEMAETPLRSLLVIGCLAGIIVSALVLRRVKSNGDALRYLLPSIAAMTLIDVCNKEIMDTGQAIHDLGDVIVYYMFITALVIGLSNLFLHAKRAAPMGAVFLPANLGKAALLLFVIIGSMTAKNYAMAWTFNPAYVSAIIILSPVWIVGLNKLLRSNAARVDFRALVCLLGFVVALVLLTR